MEIEPTENGIQDAAPAVIPSLPSLPEYLVSVTLDRFSRMLSHVGGVRLAEETEPVHQMRVWSRRSRAALDILVRIPGGKGFATIRREVRDVTRALGEARDLDVMIESLCKRADALEPAQKPGLVAVIEGLRAQRNAAQRSVSRSVSGFARFRVEERFRTRSRQAAREWARENGSARKNGQKDRGPDSDGGSKSIFIAAGCLISARAKSLLGYEEYIDRPDCSYELHQMRIAAKRLRYTMELFADLYALHSPNGEPFAAAIGEIESLQKHLGEIHDADVFVPLLTEQAVRMMKAGYGVTEHSEPVAGVHLVDFQACLGLLTVCDTIGAERDRRYQRLVDKWKQMRESDFFENLTDLLDSTARNASGCPVEPSGTAE